MLFGIFGIAKYYKILKDENYEHLLSEGMIEIIITFYTNFWTNIRFSFPKNKFRSPLFKIILKMEE